MIETSKLYLIRHAQVEKRQGFIPENNASNSSCSVTGCPPRLRSFSKPCTSLPAVVIAVG